ncbi:MAG: hypothetical protein KGY50_04970 [Candidatus Thermoplasmatota archaeon]|nr:hypothetical protein [Candidatus Thermoplasmatota archaeon]
MKINVMEDQFMNQKKSIAVIGTTPKHWATDAGRELAETLKAQLGEQNPDFIVLFFHYSLLKKRRFRSVIKKNL